MFVLLLFFSCKKEQDLVFSLKENIKTKGDLRESLKANGIITPYDIKLSNADYYYIFARVYYDNYGYDSYSKYLFEKAIDSENIFRSDAVNFYINVLSVNEEYSHLKVLLRKNIDLVNNNERVFLLLFLNDGDISMVESFPRKEEFLPLVFQIAKRKKELLKDNKNQFKLIDYFNGININSDFIKKRESQIHEIVKLSEYNPYLLLIYSFITDNSMAFKATIFEALSFIDDNESCEIIKKLCYKRHENRAFYESLKRIYKFKKRWALYHYSLESFNYKSKIESLRFLKDSLSAFKEKDDFNYNMRAKILYIEYNFNKEWINDVIDFVNDYPDLYHSRSLLNLMLRSALYQNKRDLVISLIDKINIEKMSIALQSENLYIFYLIDRKEKWKDLLLKEHPLSYGSLVLNQNKIIFNDSPYLRDDKTFTEEGRNIIKKVSTLLGFDLSNDAKRMNIDALNKNERIEIKDILYNYYIFNEDFYNAVKIAGEYASLIYGEGLIGIDRETIKRLFPYHYNEDVIKSSTEFNIEPSLIYAVMREESRYKKDIVSHANAIGLMQIIPATGDFVANKLKITSFDLANPENNIRMGTYYLQFLKRNYEDYPLILSSYNAGPGRTRSWVKLYKNFDKETMYELIPIDETRHYIRKVMRSYYIYKKLYF